MSATSHWLPAPDEASVVDALVRTFTDVYETAPDGVWAAPGRVNVIGEHVDYNGGLCLPVALEHRAYAALRIRDDATIRVRSRQSDEVWEGRLEQIGPGADLGWAGYVLGVLWALAQEGVDLPGLDLLVDGRVPVGSGLSSSAALECSVAAALADLVPALGSWSRADLAAACVRAENEIAGASTGGLDQTVALRAQAEHALLLDCLDFSVQPVRWAPAEHDLALLVMDTRATHQLADGQYASRRADCERAAAVLGVSVLREVDEIDAALQRLAREPDGEVLVARTRHVLTEIRRVAQAADALTTGDLDLLGALMNASHVSLRDDYQVSSPELDLAVEVAQANGALGARMTGGGFGGSAIAVVPVASQEQVADAVTAAFAERGFDAPQFLSGDASGPAARLR